MYTGAATMLIDFSKCKMNVGCDFLHAEWWPSVMRDMRQLPCHLHGA